MSAYKKLKDTFTQLSRLKNIQGIMQWDEAVMMPEGAGSDRAKTMATLNGAIHKIISNKKNKALLIAAKQETGLSTWDQANLMWMEKVYNMTAILPNRLTEKLTLETLACEQAWRKLRSENNWRDFLPSLKKVFKLVKEVAQRRSQVLQLSPYNAMLDEYAPGFNQQSIDIIFSELKTALPGIIQKIIKKQAQDALKTPQGPFSIEKQKQVGLKIMAAMSFNFNQGRLDVSHHPFCGGNPSDVRITTRYNENEIIPALMGICHETGHALYEQGLPREWIDQPVGSVNSMAMHESQSLLIEREVCGSPAFYQYLTPHLTDAFGHQQALSAENLHKIATRVTSGYIRVNADEVTYPLHIVLRYELEKALFEGSMAIDDLPHHWDELMKKYLNLSTHENYKDGVMQDVHWPCGAFGYFPAYSLGRLIAAQIFPTFKKAHPQFFDSLAQGDFMPLIQWLSNNVYCYAAALPTQQLLVKITGEELSPKYFLEKFADNKNNDL